jgi:hypothetical protein
MFNVGNTTISISGGSPKAIFEIAYPSLVLPAGAVFQAFQNYWLGLNFYVSEGGWMEINTPCA